MVTLYRLRFGTGPKAFTVRDVPYRRIAWWRNTYWWLRCRVTQQRGWSCLG